MEPKERGVVCLRRICRGSHVVFRGDHGDTRIFTSTSRRKILVEEVLEATSEIVGRMTFWKGQTSVEDAADVYLGTRRGPRRGPRRGDGWS